MCFLPQACTNRTHKVSSKKLNVEFAKWQNVIWIFSFSLLLQQPNDTIFIWVIHIKNCGCKEEKKSSINDFINHAGHFQQALYICLYTNLHNINLREEIKGSVRRMRRGKKSFLGGCKKISFFFEKENMEKSLCCNLWEKFYFINLSL